MERLNGFKYGLKKHFADATSMSFLSIPIKCVTDQLAGISDVNSMEARVKMVGLNYLGLVQLFKLRDYSKKKLGVAKTANKALHYLHDIGFMLGLGMPIQAGVYFSSGVDDWKKMAITLGISLGTLVALSGPLGQGIDIYREITRVKKSKNTPAYFKRLSNSARKKWAVGLVVGSLALTGALYSLIPNRTQAQEQLYQSQGIEQVIEGEDIVMGGDLK